MAAAPSVAQSACDGANNSIKKDIAGGSTATWSSGGPSTTCAGGVLLQRDLDTDTYATTDVCCVVCAGGDTTCTTNVASAAAWHGYYKASVLTVSAVADCDDTSGIAASVHPGVVETCNGVDDDCVGGIDDVAAANIPLTANQTGVCAGAKKTCQGATGFANVYTGIATYQSTETLCDGLDNDCGGTADDIAAANVPATTLQAGVCAGAKKTCQGVAGYADVYSGIATYQATETLCDNLDNNCDGTKDNIAAADTPLTTLQAGVCAGAKQTCGGAAGFQNVYTGIATYQATETLCDNLDNNCDGTKDNIAAADVPLTANQSGVCAGAKKTCQGASGFQNVYTSLPDYEATELSCDDLDNNCDGTKDNFLVGNLPLTTNQLGVCSNARQSCKGVLGFQNDYSVVSNYEQTEVSCDNLDNNCDGSKDNILAANTPLTTKQAGLCAGTRKTCQGAAGFADVYSAVLGYEATELSCDNQDNDCDGTRDNIAAANVPLTTNQTGVCLGAKKTCQGVAGFADVYTSVPFYEATEATCDGKDNDCDASIDEGVQTTYFRDADHDNHGDPLQSTDACTAVGYVLDNTDCDDNSPVAAQRFPGNAEVVGDTIDQDCDAQLTCYVDSDGDTYGAASGTNFADANAPQASCKVPGSSDVNTDCDDNTSGRHPGLAEIVNDGVDQNCVQGDVCFKDGDDDGYRPDAPSTVVSADLDCLDAFEAVDSDPITDCDDADVGRNPGLAEIADDGIDQDCSQGDVCFKDADDDGFRPDATSTVVSADLDCLDAFEARASDPTTDCDDLKAGRHPGFPEVVNDGIDQDCSQGDLCFTDADDDGHRPNGTDTTVSADLDCQDAAEAVGADPTDDCDDTNAGRHPGLVEIVGDGIDQDCLGGDTCFKDSDNDGYRPDSVTTVVSADGDCDDPGEALGTDPVGDCDDDTAGRHPDLAEVIDDGVDQDCVLGDLCYTDDDDDGFRPNTTSTTLSFDLDCKDAFEAVGADPTTDCDDTNPTRHPGATEIPANGVDEDCFSGDLCFTDVDGDGYRPGAGTATILSDDLLCDGPGEASANNPPGDCLDNDARRYPTSAEFCSQVSTPAHPCEACEPGTQLDDDCNGDANSAGPGPVFLPPESGPGVLAAFEDADGDGYGSNALGAVLLVCEIPVGASTNDLDCNDDPITGVDIHPGVFEKCDNVDQNCNGTKDEAEAIDPANPGDAGCVVLYRDRDLDGTGDPTVSHCLCTDPRVPSAPYDPVSDTDAGDTDYFDQVQEPSPLHGSYAGDEFVAPPTDCDDAHADIRPDECHDGLDNDGDGWVDARDVGCTLGTADGVQSASESNRASTLRDHPDSFAVVLDKIDGHDNDCDGEIPIVELDCDDDGSFPLLPVNPPPETFRTYKDLQLTSCVDEKETPAFQCWDQSLEITCDKITGLWVTRYGASDDGFGGRYAGGYRVLTNLAGCARQGDCDDHCPSRCPNQVENCDGVDNDCTLVDGTLEADQVSIPESLSSAPPVGTVVLAELDFDGDGHASCTEDFLDGDTPIHEAPRTCAAFGEEVKLSDCDDLCFYANPDAVETCDGFVNVCGAPSSAREGVDKDGDQFTDCGAYGPADGIVEEDVFVPVWVDCDPSSVEGTALNASCVRSVPAANTSAGELPRLVPLISPRPGAPVCDAPLNESLVTLAKRAGIADAEAWVAGADALTLVQALCAPSAPTGGLCSNVQITILRDDEVVDAGSGGALTPECAAVPEQATVRTVWSSTRVLEARDAVVENECLRLFGLPCNQIRSSSPRVALGAPPVVDAQLEGKIGETDTDAVGDAPWWLELGRFVAHTTGGAVMQCWGDPRVEAISARTGGDCDDSTANANRDLPEGPNDLVLAYNGDNGDCSRCVDGIDNNCDGLTDCADPTCAVCFVGQGQGCAGAKDACGDAVATGGGCTNGPESQNLAILGLVPLLGLVSRRRAARAAKASA